LLFTHSFFFTLTSLFGEMPAAGMVVDLDGRIAITSTGAAGILNRYAAFSFCEAPAPPLLAGSGGA
jgi:hypothetical protein